VTTDRSVVLSGFIGTGKSTLGPMVAARLGLPFVDTDDEIARRSGERVPDLWRARGEAVFRVLEEDLVRELFADGIPRVVSFGGGTATLRAVRHLVLDRALLITLTARPETVLSRTQRLEERPTLAGPDPLARITSLLEQRATAYAECHVRVATDELSVDEAVARIAEEYHRSRIAVPLGERSYSVHVVDDAPGAVARVLTELRPSSVLVVTDTAVRAARGAALDASLPPELPVTHVTLASGEENKTLASVEAIWRAALAAEVDRDAVVLAFGGGVVGDLGGFAASTLLRGLRVVQVPTTLLAMVDASVGGKTGFDVPQGKNLIGSFHQPSAVVVDFAHLSTLPLRDFRAGLAEIAKVALACDETLWEALERDADALRDGVLAALGPIASRAIVLKARLVRDDERERGPRALLNLGHTVGHALEALGGYARYRHGEAVAIGLVAEATVAERLGAARAGLADRVRLLLTRLGLPADVPKDELIAAWPYVALDKKRARGSVLLPLVYRIGAAAVKPVALGELGTILGASDAR
jgi:shikimate kinase/3-dehydroquinate synthase